MSSWPRNVSRGVHGYPWHITLIGLDPADDFDLSLYDEDLNQLAFSQLGAGSLDRIDVTGSCGADDTRTCIVGVDLFGGISAERKYVLKITQPQRSWPHQPRRMPLFMTSD